jgi:hypothetical protein
MPNLELDIDLSNLPVKRLEMIHEALHQLSEQSWQFVRCILDDLGYALSEIGNSLRDDDSIFAQQTADLVGLCSPRAHETLAGAV